MDIDKNNLLFVEIKHLIQTEDMDIWNYKNELITLIDEAIARQSVATEEVPNNMQDSVQKAIVILTEWRDFLSGTLPADAEGTREIMSYNLAITALQQYQPWVPVSERLPESGKHILLCCELRPSGKRYVCDGYYAQEKSITSGYSDECSNEYDEETDEYYLTEGYYEIIKNWGDYSSIVIDDFVTHWKPLPELPKGE